MIYVVVAVSLETKWPVEKRLLTYRTWGYYSSREEAVLAIEQNRTDYLENGYYNYALLNHINPGLCASPSKQEWWSWNGDLENPKLNLLDFDPLNLGSKNGRRVIVW